MTVLLDYGPDLVAPRYLQFPDHYDTHGDEVAGLCADADYAPDEQQQLVLDAIFARQKFTREEILATFADAIPDKRLLNRIIPDDGTWPRELAACYETAVIAGRQNLKSGTCKQAALGWLYLFDEPMVSYSAHVFDTAMTMFADIIQLIDGKDFLRKRVKKIIRSHGEQAIILHRPKAGEPDPTLKFMTRTKGGARGLTGTKIIFDEAYALADEHMGAILPIVSATPDPQILYGSAAGMADSSVLRDARNRGRAGGNRFGYFEWAAPPPEEACDKGTACTHAKDETGCGCDKPQYWLEANPAIGVRMSVQSVMAERQAMPVGEFMRERMGWWDEPAGAEVRITEAIWAATRQADSTVAVASTVALGLDVAPDGSVASIGLAGWHADTKPHVELIRHEVGIAWVVDALVEISDRQDPCVLMLDPAGPAGAMEKELRLKGFKVLPVNTDTPPLATGQHRMHLMSARDVAQACGAFSKAAHTDALHHPDNQAPLDTAVKVAKIRNVAQAWAWAPDPRDPSPITPLVAVTLAHMGLLMFGARPAMQPFFISSS